MKFQMYTDYNFRHLIYLETTFVLQEKRTFNAPRLRIADSRRFVSGVICWKRFEAGKGALLFIPTF